MKLRSDHGRKETFCGRGTRSKILRFRSRRSRLKFVLILIISDRMPADTTMLGTGKLLHVRRWNYYIIMTRPKQLKARYQTPTASVW